MLGILLAVFVYAPRLNAQGIGTRAKIHSFTMPQYNERDNRLQFIVFGQDADNRGGLILLNHMIIDFIQNNLEDIQSVKILDDAIPYPLTASKKEIDDFWKDKQHSQGLVFSEKATLDKSAKILHSLKPVKFRSTFLDVDGVGFDAYQNRKFLHIRSDVKLKLRPKAREQAMSGHGSENVRKSATDFFNEEIKQQSNTKMKD